MSFKQFAIVDGTGTAVFQQYDNGWRIRDVSLKYGKDAATLTEAEVAEIQQDIEAEQKRQQEKREQERQQAAALWARIKVAVKPTKTFEYGNLHREKLAGNAGSRGFRSLTLILVCASQRMGRKTSLESHFI